MLRCSCPRVKLKLKWMWHEKFETDVPRDLQKKEIVFCYQSVRDTEPVDCMAVLSKIEFWGCIELLRVFISLPRNFQGPDKKPGHRDLLGGLKWYGICCSDGCSSPPSRAVEESHQAAQKSWILICCRFGVESQSISFGQVIEPQLFHLQNGDLVPASRT